MHVPPELSTGRLVGTIERARRPSATRHLSGVDPLFALDQAVRAGAVRDGDPVLLLAAGTGDGWAASTVRWSAAQPDEGDE